MKSALFIILSVCLFSCAQMEQMGKQAANETINRMTTTAVRKTQMKIERKLEAQMDSLTKPRKPYKRLSEMEKDSTISSK